MARVTVSYLSAENRGSWFCDEAFGWKFERTNAPNPTWNLMSGSSDEPGIDGMLITGARDKSVVNTIEVSDIEFEMPTRLDVTSISSRPATAGAIPELSRRMNRACLPTRPEGIPAGIALRAVQIELTSLCKLAQVSKC